MYAFVSPDEVSRSVLTLSQHERNATAVHRAISHSPDVCAEKAAILNAVSDGCSDFEVRFLSVL